MNVGLIIYGTLDTVSGGYLYDRKLVEHLQQHGDSVELVSLPARRYGTNLLDNVSRDLHHRLSTARFDILLQDELNHPSLVVLNRRLRGRVDYPIVSIVHHLRSSESWPGWQRRIYQSVERQYLRTVDGFVFNSRTTQQAVESLSRESRPSIVAYPAGDRLTSDINQEWIRRRSKGDGPLRIAFIGGVIPRKGLHVLLNALSHIRNVPWRLTVAGDLNSAVDYTASIRGQISELGLSRDVDLVGNLNDRDLARVLRESHLLVMPSSYEGFGIAYLEGMGFGLPVIASTAGGASEIVAHGENGFLVEPDDEHEIARYVESLHTNRDLLNRMSIAALRRFGEHPTWDQSMAQASSFLQMMARQR